MDTNEIMPVPDAVMDQYLEACRLALEACWTTAHMPRAYVVDSPSGDAFNARWNIEKALEAAREGDGADAVIGFSLAAKAKATKALRRFVAGEQGRVVPPSRGMFGI